MSADPAGAIQRAVFQALRTALAGAPVAGRIFDRVASPAAPIIHPYVAFGAAQTLEDGADDCIDGSESYLDLHVWSEEVGFTQVKQIADTIRATLNRADLTLDGHALVEMQVTQTRYLRDPDGLTSHAVVELRVLTEAAS